MIKQSGIIVTLLFCIGLSIYGQFEQMVIPADLKQQTIVTEPSTLNKGFLRVGLNGSFQSFDRYFDLDGSRGYLLNSNTWRKSWTYYLSVEYGLTDRIQLALSQPYLNGKTYISYNMIVGGLSKADTTISGRSKEQGFGDLSVSISYQILKEGDIWPSVTGSVSVTFPTGRKEMKDVVSSLEYNGPTGSGFYSLMYNLLVRKVFYPFSATISADYLQTFKGKKDLMYGLGEVEFNMADNFALTGGFYAHLNDWIVIGSQVSFTKPIGEIAFYYDPPSVAKPDSYILSYNPEIYFQIRRVRFYENTIIPLFGKDGSADPVYRIGLQYLF